LVDVEATRCLNRVQEEEEGPSPLEAQEVPNLLEEAEAG